MAHPDARIDLRAAAPGMMNARPRNIADGAAPGKKTTPTVSTFPLPPRSGQCPQVKDKRPPIPLCAGTSPLRWGSKGSDCRDVKASPSQWGGGPLAVAGLSFSRQVDGIGAVGGGRGHIPAAHAKRAAVPHLRRTAARHFHAFIPLISRHSRSVPCSPAAATGAMNTTSALATVTVIVRASSASAALKYTVYSPALTAAGISG